ncbi:GNAT family N-acetyltransferase [Pseudoduganella sp. RAF19]|uniref:GNAT family N-acetyltransferase n=2 Tax=unclassified Pseudoduganella TaxID=2637179 RepID=UPI003F9661F1
MAISWIETTNTLDWEELSALYYASLGPKDPPRLKLTFSNSMFKLFAYDDGKLVGAGRALADGMDCSYLCDVAVLPSHQGTGLGKAIVAHLLEKSRGHKKIILYAVPGKENFYRQFGFRRMTTAMAIFEDQAAAADRGYLAD